MKVLICLTLVQKTASNWQERRLLWFDASFLVTFSRPPQYSSSCVCHFQSDLQHSVCASNLHTQPLQRLEKKTKNKGSSNASDSHENWSSEAQHVFYVKAQNKTGSLFKRKSHLHEVEKYTKLFLSQHFCCRTLLFKTRLAPTMTCLEDKYTNLLDESSFEDNF